MYGSVNLYITYQFKICTFTHTNYVSWMCLQPDFKCKAYIKAPNTVVWLKINT